MYDIVWLDGTYGIGKTTVARNLIKYFSNEDITFLDSDYFYLDLGKKDLYKIAFGGTSPQNNINFINYFREIIEKHLTINTKPLIVAMALTQKECKEQLFDSLENEKIKILHVILTAKPEIIKERLNSNRDDERMRFALEHLNANLSFLENNFKNAIRIDTENNNCDNISREILSYLTDK